MLRPRGKSTKHHAAARWRCKERRVNCAASWLSLILQTSDHHVSLSEHNIRRGNASRILAGCAGRTKARHGWLPCPGNLDRCGSPLRTLNCSPQQLLPARTAGPLRRTLGCRPHADDPARRPPSDTAEAQDTAVLSTLATLLEVGGLPPMPSPSCPFVSSWFSSSFRSPNCCAGVLGFVGHK